MEREKLYQLALHYTPGVGNINIKQLVSYCGSPEEVFRSTVHKLSKIPGIGENTARSILKKETFTRAEEELKKCEKEKSNLVFFTDPNYPKRLKQINDAPPLLYCKGNYNLEKQKSIAIVGTRNATNYGKDFTDSLLQDLAKHDPVIISGLAYGIDIQAHKAAIRNGLQTIGVMASGINIIYPATHEKYTHQMMENGGLVTEYPIGSKPDAPRFPARNRIIAGMADAVIVVEAAKKGGALITAEIANSYNRDVFAVPGNLGANYSEGCNNLIKSHKAHLITGVKDLEYIMQWDIDNTKRKDKEKELSLNLDNFDKDEIIILTLLKKNGDAMLIDDLSWKSQIPVSMLASILLNLEFKGVVGTAPGKKFKILKKPQ